MTCGRCGKPIEVGYLYRRLQWPGLAQALVMGTPHTAGCMAAAEQGGQTVSERCAICGGEIVPERFGDYETGDWWHVDSEGDDHHATPFTKSGAERDPVGNLGSSGYLKVDRQAAWRDRRKETKHGR